MVISTWKYQSKEEITTKEEAEETISKVVKEDRVITKTTMTICSIERNMYLYHFIWSID